MPASSAQHNIGGDHIRVFGQLGSRTAGKGKLFAIVFLFLAFVVLGKLTQVMVHTIPAISGPSGGKSRSMMHNAPVAPSPINAVPSQTGSVVSPRVWLNEKIKMAEAGDARAALDVAIIYYHGHASTMSDAEIDSYGVKEDRMRGFEWLKKSIDLGSTDAMSVLGNMYLHGDVSVEKNDLEAVAWWTRSAEHGNLNTAVYVGNLYYYGQIVSRDYKKAFQFYKMAAEGGNASAMQALGAMYHYGHGVSVDDAVAVSWLRKSASLGNQKANEMLDWLSQSNHTDNDQPAKAYRDSPVAQRMREEGMRDIESARKAIEGRRRESRDLQKQLERPR
jgi:TPR repeat protein